MTDETLTILQRNWRSVTERIRRAAADAGRRADAVTLVAVTKSVGADVALALRRLGQEDLGENRVQELERKTAAFADAGAIARWHLVGPIQANKVRKAVRAADLLHAVDAADLLPRLDRIAAEEERTARFLLEVNVSGEAAKHGVAPADVADVLAGARGLAHAKAAGLMTMAPLDADLGQQRAIFRTLRGLRDRAADGGLLPGAGEGPGELSMGMSGDFETAIAEGATLVRVGTALFEGLPGRPVAA